VIHHKDNSSQGFSPEINSPEIIHRIDLPKSHSISNKQRKTKEFQNFKISWILHPFPRKNIIQRFSLLFGLDDFELYDYFLAKKESNL
jgi:hypothetical protein